MCQRISGHKVKQHIAEIRSQWGNDPIWHTINEKKLNPNFPDAIAIELSLSLEEDANKRVNVVGFPVVYDEDRQKWFCDLSFKAQLTY